MHRKTGARVVVLVDEYDKPILDAIEAPELANANRDDLRGLYGTLKDYDAHVEMSFITGVSRFSKVSLLSDLNNLTDITLNALAPHWRSAGDRGALRRSLAAQDWCGVETLFRKLLAGIPHDWHRRNEISRYEGYWSSVFYAWFQASMDSVAVEDATSRGRLDMAVLLAGNAYLFEFKVAEHSGPGTALAQLRARRYADKYRASTRAVHLIGVEISGDSRDIMVFETESA